MKKCKIHFSSGTVAIVEYYYSKVDSDARTYRFYDNSDTTILTAHIEHVEFIEWDVK